MNAVLYARFSSHSQNEEYLSLSRSKNIKPIRGLGNAYT